MQSIVLDLIADHADSLAASTPWLGTLNCGRLFSTTALFAPGLLGYPAFEIKNNLQSLYTTHPGYPNGLTTIILREEEARRIGRGNTSYAITGREAAQMSARPNLQNTLRNLHC